MLLLTVFAGSGNAQMLLFATLRNAAYACRDQTLNCAASPNSEILLVAIFAASEKCRKTAMYGICCLCKLGNSASYSICDLWTRTNADFTVIAATDNAEMATHKCCYLQYLQPLQTQKCCNLQCSQPRTKNQGRATPLQGNMAEPHLCKKKPFRRLEPSMAEGSFHSSPMGAAAARRTSGRFEGLFPALGMGMLHV